MRVKPLSFERGSSNNTTQTWEFMGLLDLAAERLRSPHMPSPQMAWPKSRSDWDSSFPSPWSSPWALIFKASQEAFEAVHIRARPAALGFDPHKLHPSFTQLKMLCWTIEADTKDSLRLFSPSTKLEYIQSKVFKDWTLFSQSASQGKIFSLLALMFFKDFKHGSWQFFKCFRFNL